MNRILLGALAALVLEAVGIFWLQSRDQVERGAPPPSGAALAEAPKSDKLPTADVGNMRGPAPPQASELTAEQQRFFRYDRNRDWVISRNEMMATRADGFRKLDKDGNNLLTFEEWAVATSDRFATADANHDGMLSPAEFASTKPKPAPKPKCGC